MEESRRRARPASSGGDPESQRVRARRSVVTSPAKTARHSVSSGVTPRELIRETDERVAAVHAGEPSRARIMPRAHRSPRPARQPDGGARALPHGAGAGDDPFRAAGLRRRERRSRQSHGDGGPHARVSGRSSARRARTRPGTPGRRRARPHRLELRQRLRERAGARGAALVAHGRTGGDSGRGRTRCAPAPRCQAPGARHAVPGERESAGQGLLAGRGLRDRRLPAARRRGIDLRRDRGARVRAGAPGRCPRGRRGAAERHRTADDRVLERLERDLGKPVVSSIQACLWQALRVAGRPQPIAGFGRLLRDVAR